MKNRFRDTHVSPADRFSIGDDLEAGGHFLAIPVTSSVVDYEERYRLSAEQYAGFAADLTSALSFVGECRRRLHDDLLIHPPGSRRGSPT
ncbi:hypothetical protein CIW49_13470 [Mycolicibacterium sp. P1-18]|uniref:hypothetical protein n=1 Tax=Mycolicibacterium sp. P1-18 TaxID=2024615 RepID=UPI0011F0A3DB|nr:hypothetical protein [Mycolicibacterium sp. P1-18]KAA0098884.1 hypothetical protein CIW49_13470 [Mycolicibacterium sp. P1-18]